MGVGVGIGKRVVTGSLGILQRDGCNAKQWPEPCGLSGNVKENSQAGPLGPVASWARRLYGDSSYLKVIVPWFGSEAPSTGQGGVTLCLFLPGKSRCRVGSSCGAVYEKSCTAEPQAEPGKGCEVNNTSLIHCWKRHRQLQSLYFRTLWPSCLQHLLWFGGEEGMTLCGVQVVQQPRVCQGFLRTSTSWWVPAFPINFKDTCEDHLQLRICLKLPVFNSLCIAEILG